MSTDAPSDTARLSSSGFIRSQGFIGGKWTDAYDGKTIEVHNPATGELITNVSCMGARETHDAIASAHEAFASWSKVTAAERSKCLRKWYDLLMAHKEELGQLMTLEQGKPLKEAIGEVGYGASFVEFFAEEAELALSQTNNKGNFIYQQGIYILAEAREERERLATKTEKMEETLLNQQKQIKLLLSQSTTSLPSPP